MGVESRMCGIETPAVQGSKFKIMGDGGHEGIEN